MIEITLTETWDFQITDFDIDKWRCNRHFEDFYMENFLQVKNNIEQIFIWSFYKNSLIKFLNNQFFKIYTKINGRISYYQFKNMFYNKNIPIYKFINFLTNEIYNYIDNRYILEILKDIKDGIRICNNTN
jgi:hypothetical protein